MQISKCFISRLNQYVGYPAMIEERDACGVGFLAYVDQTSSSALVKQALGALKCMEHRGACSADRISGDGSGITTQIPWKLFLKDIPNNFLLDESQTKNLAIGMVFFPQDGIIAIKKIFHWILEQYNCKIIHWRSVPTNDTVLGYYALKNQPVIEQCIIYSNVLLEDEIEKILYLARKTIEKYVAQIDSNQQFYVCSLSSRVIVYKGMVKAEALGVFYLDLLDSLYVSSFAIYHRRFSTNTKPKWSLAQPMRFIAHNGEINTLIGNLNWMRSKETIFLDQFSGDLIPITDSNNSDSSNLDAVLELFIMSGRSPQEGLMILIPEAYEKNPEIKNLEEIVDFYDYYAGLQEPWDGPALVVFTDGKMLGATLDRNGLRPARYSILDNGLVVLSSEAGVINLNSQNIIKKGRLGPGQMFCIDLVNQTIQENWLIKQSISNNFPYRKWLNEYQRSLPKQPYLEDERISQVEMVRWHTAFGYTSEDVELVIEHMAGLSKEPTFCMGDDIPLAILSERPHLLYNYFKQRFAQVTNPAIDPLRESLVMSLNMHLGSKGNILKPTENMAKLIKLKSPIINEEDLKTLSSLHLKTVSISIYFHYSSVSLKDSLKNICEKVVTEIHSGAEIIILTDRLEKLSADYTFIPPLLIVGTLHHFLINEQLRQRVSLVVDTGQCWSTHHFACLIGYGASAVCPYMAFKTVRQWWHHARTQKLMKVGKLSQLSLQRSQDNYKQAINAGLLKILSKMGISLLSSYHGSQIFEVLGLNSEVINLAFKGTTSRLQGLSLDELFHEHLSVYNQAFRIDIPKNLVNHGYVQYRPSAEYHVNNPGMSKALHKAVRSKDGSLYNKYRSLLKDRPLTNLRDLLDFSSDRKPISLSEVEPLDRILQRFCTGGMSLGALSRETHETLAIAMNRIGGKSNSGEGGEDKARFYTISDINRLGLSRSFAHLKGLKQNDTANSAIKQIASGRFGVTPYYLINAEQLEIKIAQGAKPGEGGQLPGKKVSDYIAALRNCKPGVTLISPPPHHDIYSIEDLSQLIFDLHQINPKAQVSVKLVSEIGIGTIAAGVAKGNADIIQISGHDGGTGASPLSSIKHAGSPWELGLTEVHQTLVQNQLRDKVLLRVDGGLRTGKDIVVAALMGAEEFGFGTIAMIATGCVMARICHTNNCPVGVASQRVDLRRRFPGIPADLVNFFVFIAQEVREILANLGYKNLQQLIGHVALLKVNKQQVRKTVNFNLDNLLFYKKNRSDVSLMYPKKTVHSNILVLDDFLLNDSFLLSAIANQKSYFKYTSVINTDRTIGARVSGKIVNRYGNSEFKGSLNLVFQGTVGQSFGAFISTGMNLTVIGEANDYVGKGMSGGKITIVPSVYNQHESCQQVILGNTCLYGATGGMLLASGQAGERFAVRNSCAHAVVEGVGDHACEYMTGGIIVVIGVFGRNIAAGMTGGIGYFLDEKNILLSKVNQDIVKVKKITTREGEKQLFDLVNSLQKETGSMKATQIINSWENYLPMFWQIVPPSEMKNPLVNLASSAFQSLSL
uniref:Ferredoxin-dependent glutamate synthase n=1 Tax=Porolithon onkodes TaxID=231751 RepID=A0A2Z2L623_9FLOR|nr:ferredoxin-dependent glutamate synthase [Porolithon onkodes]ASB29800.1 ferredoxin-dependent glutamate synthase [Porolithon onkodes]